MDLAQLSVSFEADLSALQSAISEGQSLLQAFSTDATGLTKAEFSGDTSQLQTASTEAQGELTAFQAAATGLSAVQFEGDASGLTSTTDQARSDLDSFSSAAAGLGTVEFNGDVSGLSAEIGQANSELAGFKSEADAASMVSISADASELDSAISGAMSELSGFQAEADAAGNVVITADTSDFQGNVGNAGESADQFGTHAQSAKESASELGATSAEAGGLMGALGETMGSTAGIAGTLGGIAGFGAVSAGLEIGVNDIREYNIAMGQGQRTMQLVTGSADETSAHLRELADFARTSPFDFPDLEILDQRMINVGFSTQDTIPIFKAAGDAAIAMGRGQEGIDNITNALKLMETQGEVTSRPMMALSREGIPIWENLAKVLNTDVAGAHDMVKQKVVEVDQVVKAFEMGSEQQYGGQMEAKMQTLGGTLSMIRETFIEVTATAIKPFMTAVGDAGVAIGGLINTSGFQTFMMGIATSVASTLTGVRDFAATIGGALMPVIQGVISALSPWMPMLQSIAQTIAGPLVVGVTVLAAILGGSLVASLFTAVAGFITGTTVITSFVAGLGLIQPAIAIGVAAFTLLIQHWSELTASGTVLGNAFDYIKGKAQEGAALVQAAWASVGPMLRDGIGAALDWLQARWADIAPGAEAALSGLSSAFSIAMGVIGPVVQGGITVVTTAFQTVWPIVQQTAVVVGQTLVAAWQAVQPAIAPVVDLLGGSLIRILETVALVIGGAIVVAIVAFVAALATIAVAVLAAVAGVALLVTGIIAAVTAIVHAGESVVSFIASLPSLGSAASSAGSAIGSAFSGAYNAVVNWLGQAVAYVRSWGASVVAAVSGVAAPIVAAVQAGWQRVVQITQTVLGPIANIVRQLFLIAEAAILLAYTVISSYVSAGWQRVVSLTQSVLAPVGSFVSEIWNGLVSIISTAITTVEDWVSTGWQFVSDETTSIWTAVQAYLQTWWDWLVGLVTPYVTNIETLIQTGWQYVSDQTTAIWTAVQSFLQTWWDWLVGLVTPYVQNIETLIQTGWQYISDQTNTIWTAIQSFLQSIWDDITSIFNTAVNGLETFLSDAWTSIQSTAESGFHTIAHAIVDPMVDAVNTVMDVISSLGNWLADELDSWGVGSSIASALRAGAPSHVANPLPFAEGGFRGAGEVNNQSFATGGVSSGTPGYTTSRMVEWGEELQGQDREYFLTENKQHEDRNRGLWAEYGNRMGFASGGMMESFASGGSSPSSVQNIFGGPGNADISQVSNTGRGVTINPTHSFSATQSVNQSPGGVGGTGGTGGTGGAGGMAGAMGAPGAAGTPGSSLPINSMTPLPGGGYLVDVTSGDATIPFTTGSTGLTEGMYDLMPDTTGMAQDASGAQSTTNSAGLFSDPLIPGGYYIDVTQGGSTAPASGGAATPATSGVTPGTASGTTPGLGSGTTPSGSATGGAASGMPSATTPGASASPSGATAGGTSASTTPGKWYSTTGITSGMVPTKSLRWMPPPPATSSTSTTGTGTTTPSSTGTGTTPTTGTGATGTAPTTGSGATGTPGAGIGATGLGTGTSGALGSPSNPYPNSPPQSGGVPAGVDPAYYGYPPDPTIQSGGGIYTAARTGLPVGLYDIYPDTTGATAPDATSPSSGSSPTGSAAPSGSPSGGAVGRSVLSGTNAGTNTLNKTSGSPTSSNFANVSLTSNTTSQIHRFGAGGWMGGRGEGWGDTTYDWNPEMQSIVDREESMFGTAANTYVGHGDEGFSDEPDTADFWGPGGRGDDISNYAPMGDQVLADVWANYSNDIMYWIWNGTEWRYDQGSMDASIYNGDDMHYDHVHVSLFPGGGAGGGGGALPGGAAGSGGGASGIGAAFSSAITGGASAILGGLGSQLAPAGQVGAGLASAATSIGKNAVSAIVKSVMPSLSSRGGAGLSKDVSGLISQYFPADAQGMADMVVGRESGGDPTAQNPSGASGLFQIMPSTAEALGYDPSQLFDPAYNAMVAGALYQSQGWAPWSETAFAEGGIVTSPVLGTIGEGGQDEAVIPLPAGATDFVEKMSHGSGDTAAIARQLADLKATVEKQHAMDRAHGTHVTNTGELAQMGAASAHAALASDAGKETMDKNISQSLGYFNNYLGDTV